MQQQGGLDWEEFKHQGDRLVSLWDDWQWRYYDEGTTHVGSARTSADFSSGRSSFAFLKNTQIATWKKSPTLPSKNDTKEEAEDFGIEVLSDDETLAEDPSEFRQNPEEVASYLLDYHILYSSSYQVPVIYFNASDTSISTRQTRFSHDQH
eukprot:TRINITY_DN149_c0_g1_i4.p1 TRINITY_DN149_c0_g1~~TRINITY_DN149_c0_g1_i4.p1  ORF type:complete len:151 (-),score=31.50 TRINITY_DN149_c0_g1_i4:21-473(-)